MHARHAFIHWHVNESLETVEFDEAHSNMTDLIQDYEMLDSASVDEAGAGEEDDVEGHTSESLNLVSSTYLFLSFSLCHHDSASPPSSLFYFSLFH
jgi:hypothetical protein